MQISALGKCETVHGQRGQMVIRDLQRYEDKKHRGWTSQVSISEPTVHIQAAEFKCFSNSKYEEFQGKVTKTWKLIY